MNWGRRYLLEHAENRLPPSDRVRGQAFAGSRLPHLKHQLAVEVAAFTDAHRFGRLR
jgi:hypothetical protein